MIAETRIHCSVRRRPMSPIAVPGRHQGSLSTGSVANGSSGPVDLVDLGHQPGAYLLAIDLRMRTTVVIAGRPLRTLVPGCYLYCGSAHGPGGLAARLRRHLRADKKPHWHIDQLTVRAGVAGIAVSPAGRECDIVDLLTDAAAVSVPFAGFGSSDCRRCSAHLLQVAGRFQVPPELLSVRLPGEGKMPPGSWPKDT